MSGWAISTQGPPLPARLVIFSWLGIVLHYALHYSLHVTLHALHVTLYTLHVTCYITLYITCYMLHYIIHDITYKQIPEAVSHEAALAPGDGNIGLGLNPPVAVNVLGDDGLLEPEVDIFQ